MGETRFLRAYLLESSDKSGSENGVELGSVNSNLDEQARQDLMVVSPGQRLPTREIVGTPLALAGWPWKLSADK